MNLKIGQPVKVYEDPFRQNLLFAGKITAINPNAGWLENLIEVEIEDGTRRLLKDFQCVPAEEK